MAESAVLEVLAPGLQTSVQDLGRRGYARYGVAASGALDTFALRAANLLVGNHQGAACLETMLLGLRVRALCDVVVAVTGADLQPFRGQRPFPMWQSRILRRGEDLAFKGPRSGLRAYLAVGGGVNVAPVMGSRATNLPAGFGGLEGRALKAGDLLPGSAPESHLAADGRIFDPGAVPVFSDAWRLRVLWGPQGDDFSAAGRQALVEGAYTVSPQSDRTGIRLSGPPIAHRKGLAESIISEGVVAGAIQVPGDRQPIILLNETVTGGYRKIATAISADLPLLGQIKPGDTIRFRAVTLADAEQALREREGPIAHFQETLMSTTTCKAGGVDFRP